MIASLIFQSSSRAALHHGHLDQVGDRAGRVEGLELPPPVAAADHPPRSQLAQHSAPRTGSTCYIDYRQLPGALSYEEIVVTKPLLAILVTPVKYLP